MNATLQLSGLTSTARWLLPNSSKWCFSGSLLGASGRSLGCAPGAPPATFPGGVWERPPGCPSANSIFNAPSLAEPLGGPPLVEPGRRHLPPGVPNQSCSATQPWGVPKGSNL